VANPGGREGAAVSAFEEIQKEPWRFDLLALLRRLERSFPDEPRIGDSASRREEFVTLGEDPFLEFPASNISTADRDPQGRIRLFVKFLGLLGPQGALPLATTEEAYLWHLTRDDAFPRFLDIFNHRFLQLFFRAWADARPIAQHERPMADRFTAYLGSFIGIGSAPYRQFGSVPDGEKLAYAGLMAPQAKSASRLQDFIAGLFGVKVEIDQFVGSWLRFEADEQTRLGRSHTALGQNAMLGSAVFSVQDKFRIRIFAGDLDTYCRFLPTGDRCDVLADAVFLYVGEQLDWDVELALPAGAVEPIRLGTFGRLGYTSWVAPNWAATDRTMRCDARFHPAERQRQKRQKLDRAQAHGA
jgi:type VI secretion system protein ImpH